MVLIKLNFKPSINKFKPNKINVIANYNKICMYIILCIFNLLLTVFALNIVNQKVNSLCMKNMVTIYIK